VAAGLGPLRAAVITHDTNYFVPLSGGKPAFPSCWDAYLNGTWLFVGAGFTGELHDEEGNNPLRGLVMVCPEFVNEHFAGCVTYETPVNVGEVRIELLSGSLVSVVPRDPANHAHFVFDLDTRRWLNP
jgi:hypothetical protein